MSEVALFTYRESMVCWANDPAGEDYPLDHDYHRAEDCDWGWVCNFDGCLTRTDDRPCPTHAPLAVPGLRLIECQAWCWSNEYRDQLQTLMEETHKHRHGVWRRWKVSRWVFRLLHLLGLVRGWSYFNGDGCQGCIDGITWRRSKR